MLTFGEAIDALQLDEVALKMDGHYDIKLNSEIGPLESTRVGFHYDTNDYNILKSLEGGELIMCFNPELKTKENYVIVKREVYEKMKQGILNL